MKKVTLILAVAIMISTNLFAQNQAEDVAKEILMAYKTKDVELLKKHASGVLKFTISKSYFEDDNIRKDIKAVENWDGEIKGIGYKTGSIAGKQINTASVYFADVPNSDNIYEVLLSNYDNQGWVMFGEGLGTEKKADFEKLSKTVSSDTISKTTKVNKDFSVETANGNTFKNVTSEKITECINKLDDDNFFIILNHKENFLQAAYSDKGYTVEYKENGIQYTANDLLSKEKTINLFIKYFNADKNWNKDTEWEKQ